MGQLFSTIKYTGYYEWNFKTASVLIHKRIKIKWCFILTDFQPNIKELKHEVW
jgi:hypothetical protein